MFKNLLIVLCFILVITFTNAQTGSIDSVLNQLDWSSAGTDDSSNYQFSSLSSVYEIEDGGYYEDASAPDANHTDLSRYHDDFSWTVPVSVHHVKVWVATVEREFSFNLQVEAGKVLSFDFQKSLCGGEGSVSATYDGEQKVSVPGLGDCAGNLYYGNGVIAPESYATLGNHWVSLRFGSTCDKHYTNLKSDFNPTLLPDSSLYIVNDAPIVRVNFQLPAYYYDVHSEYKDQCSQDPEQTYAPNGDDGCLNDYKTEIDYTQHCSFELDSDATNPEDSTESGYSYKGKLSISAKLDLNVAGFSVTRSVSSPLNWRVFVQKTIEVSSDVEIVNDHVCVTEAECSDGNGCCVDGECDCTCADYGNGYDGTYCEEDITPPTCDLGAATVTIYSDNGGCAKLYDDYVNPNFDDNSGETYVIRNYTLSDGSGEELTHLFPADNSDIQDLCFAIGTHKIQWHVQDVPLSDPHTENDCDTCSLTIIVEDRTSPFVDCHLCQTLADVADDEAAICIDGARSVVKLSDLKDHFNDQKVEDGLVTAFAGSYIDGTSNMLDCDCNVVPVYTLEFITNRWNSWEEGKGSYSGEGNGEIRVIDTHDTSPSIDFPAEQQDDGSYPLVYHASDDDGNEHSCNIAVVYDVTAPTCVNFIDDEVEVDPNNKNYSVAVDFTETSYDYEISGQDGDASWDIERTSGDIYHVGYALNETYESTITIQDQAGNQGTCIWRVTVQNPEPCVWPVCDDTPPYLVGGTCPDNIDIQCHENANCGCGDYTAPEFKDDKFVKLIKVYLDGDLYESYNNDDTAHSLPSDSLVVGTSTIKYVAYDMHDETAQCEFTVKIGDSVAPVVQGDGCPESDTLQADEGETHTEYSYSFSHADDCSLNQDVHYSGHRIGSDPVSVVPSDTLDLELGDHSFRYTATDDQGNPSICEWDIHVEDVEDPVIDCPDNILIQIEQGNSNINVPFEATAEDNDDVESIVYSDYQPGDPFTAGSYTITAVATDPSENTDSCTFEIVVEQPYEFATLSAALSSAIVSEITSEGDAERSFGATLIVTTLVNEHHKLLSQPNGLTSKIASGSNNNAQIVGDISELAGECASDAAICVQNFEFVVEFDSCEATGKVYDLNAEIDCLPTNCTEANKNEDITVSLAASNYCWQDLASVEVEASFINLDGTDYDDEIAAYDSSSYTLPTGTSVFNNLHVIGGIIHVTSAQVEIDGVTITNLKQEFFGDDQYLMKEDEFENGDLGADLSYESKATIAGFKYTESKLQLDQAFYTRFSATVSIAYAFGQGSRRMLLNTETQRQLSQDEEDLSKDATADALMMGSDSATTINSNAAVVVVKVNNCDSTNYENALSFAVAKYLHIDATRVSSSIEATTQGYCLAEISIEQSNCAGNIDILTLIQYLQEGTQDSFSEFHTYFEQSPDVSSDVSIDTNVYFVSQTPSAIYEAAQVSTSSSTSSSGLSWFYYVAAGVVIGSVIVKIMSNNNNTDKSVKHQPLQAERRYSIADLLAANERRSSVDVSNVRLHSAF